MKLTRLFIAALPALAAMAAADSFALPSPQTPQEKAGIVWDAATHDFGTFNEDVGRVTHVFTGVNQGTDTATITVLRASCGCTTPVTDKKIVAPGDTVRLSVTYDPYNRPGPFDKRITLHGSPDVHAYFNVKGTVISSSKLLLSRYPHQVGTTYRLNELSAAYGQIREDHNPSARILGVNNTEESLTPTVSDLPDWAEAMVSPETVEPGKTFAISLTAYGPKIGQLGLTSDTITVSSAEHPDMSERIPMSIILYENLPDYSAEDFKRVGYIEPEAHEVYFGDEIDLSSDEPLTRTLKLTNAGLEPVAIRRAYTVTPGFSIKAPSQIAPGESGDLEITLRPSQLRKDTGSLDARIQIIASSPLNTVTDINVYGTAADAE